MSDPDPKAPLNVRIIFYDEDQDLLRQLDAEVRRRKDGGDRTANRMDLIKQRLRAAVQALLLNDLLKTLDREVQRRQQGGDAQASRIGLLQELIAQLPYK